MSQGEIYLPRPEWADSRVVETSLLAWRQIVSSGYLSLVRLQVYEFAIWACAPGRTFTVNDVTYPYNGAISIKDARRHWLAPGGTHGQRVSDLWQMGYLERLVEKRREPITGEWTYYHVPTARVTPLVVPRSIRKILRETVLDCRDALVEWTARRVSDAQFTNELTAALFSDELLRLVRVPGFEDEGMEDE